MRRDLIAVETAELHRLHNTGKINERTQRSVQRVLDLEESSLGGEG